MANVNLSLVPWQQEVYGDNHRFKVVAAGRRCGKSHLAAVSLIAAALNGKPGKVFYVAPTQGMARDIMWDKLFELAHEIIEGHNVNNLTITLTGGNMIYLKGADRPDTLRGVSLKHLVLDEYAFMKKSVWDAILRPALSDLEGSAIFIGTPEGRNHFYDLWYDASLETMEGYKAWTFTSYDNPFLKESEIQVAKDTMPGWAFRQEYMASFDAQGSEYFDTEQFQYYDERPDNLFGNYYIACDLAGFEADAAKKTKRRDNSAIAVVFVSDDGVWWVEDVQYGRWTLDDTARRIFNVVEEHRAISVGIEKGIAQQAVMGPLSDLMRRTARVFKIELLSHGNQKKQDRILWALQGRFEHNKIKLKVADWNIPLVDECAGFPSQLVHDDLIDALSYIDQMAKVSYNFDIEQDTWKPDDLVAAY